MWKNEIVALSNKGIEFKLFFLDIVSFVIRDAIFHFRDHVKYVIELVGIYAKYLLQKSDRFLL
jgi:hypothetical protein